MNKDFPHITNGIILLSDLFLKKHAALPRLELDAGGDRCNLFWSKLAKIFNGSENLETMQNEDPSSPVFSDLSFQHSGWIATEESLKTHCNKARGKIEYALGQFQVSGQGNNSLKESQGSDDEEGHLKKELVHRIALEYACLIFLILRMVTLFFFTFIPA